LAPGKYGVSLAAPPGFYGQVFPRTVVELVDVRGCAVVNAQVYFDGRIAGRVLSVDLTPVVGATVRALRADESGRTSSSLLPSATTGTAGEFEIEHLTPARYQIAINADTDYRGTPMLPRVYHPGVETPRDATNVDLSGGQRVTLEDLIVPATVPMVTVRGDARLADGAPAVGAQVYLKADSAQLRLIGAPVTIGPDGRFVLSVPAGLRYRAVAEQRVAPGTMMRSDEVVIDAAGPVPAITLALKPIR
jgi:hypothetical protein